jgi:hypothetical protein
MGRVEVDGGAALARRRDAESDLGMNEKNRLVVVIEDSLHDEQHGDFSDIAAAVAELKRRAEIPWDQNPNVAPCTSWRTCGRAYELVEYDESHEPRKELRRVPILEVSAAGARWLVDSSRVAARIQD